MTVLLLQIAADGTLRALNCGHPWPYLIRPAPVPEPCAAGGRGSAPDPEPRRPAGPDPEPGTGERPPQRAVDVGPLGGETLPPLGVVPIPPVLRARVCGELRPGETLFLHTDGAEDARDPAGRFFPLRSVLAQAPLTPARLVAGVHAALLRHTGGRLADDVALLVLRNDRH